ncbi:hypothetical protein UNSW3_169 [Campylobacter concisus UNSW3]|uniref:Uncharacterized protein n=1 Tax=Campylobacter concisus UNSW3 TaxID=1242966 RepID=U2EUH6_9BACT|nr:hypothetical protein UNSW3_169 [Campylobacter concisus UNSW3]
MLLYKGKVKFKDIKEPTLVLRRQSSNALQLKFAQTRHIKN